MTKEKDILEFLSANTLVGRFVEPSDLKGLPANSIDVLLSNDMPIRAYTYVEMLPLPEDAMDGMFYVLPDQTVWFLEDKEWVQMYSPSAASHLVVTELPEVGAAHANVEYVLMGDVNDATTFKGTYVLSKNQWVQTSGVTDDSHVFVTALPLANQAKRGVEYVVMEDLDDPESIIGTWVSNGIEWVQTEGKAISVAYEVVDKLPTDPADIKDVFYMVYTDPTDPTTLEGAYFYSHQASGWQPLDNPEIDFKVEIVEELPATGNSHTIYLVASEEPAPYEEPESYDEYLYIGEGWEIIGTTKIDLSDYYTKSETYSKTEVDELIANIPPITPTDVATWWGAGQSS